MADPISATALFSFLNSAIKVAEYAVKIYGAESENGVFVRMIQSVRHDLEETERLLCAPSVKRKLSSIPGKLNWIKGVVLNTKGALNEIGRWVDRVRADKEGFGSVSWENRVRWAFNDHEKVVNRRMELGTCHQALSTVLSYLAGLEEAEPPADASPPAYSEIPPFDDVLSPRQRKKMLRYSENRHDAEKKRQGSVGEAKSQSIIITSTSVSCEVDSSKDTSKLPAEPNCSQIPNLPSTSTWSPSQDHGSTAVFTPTIYEPGSQEQSPKKVETLPILPPRPRSVLLVSKQSLSPEIQISSAWSPMPAGSLISRTQSLTPGPSQRYGGQAGVPSQTVDNQPVYTTGVYSRSIPSYPPSPSSLAQIPCPTLQQEILPQLSATNSVGPVNMFDFVAELDTQADSTHELDVQLSKDTFSYPQGAVELFVPDGDPKSARSPSVQSNGFRNSAIETERVAELIGDLSVCNLENRALVSEMPDNIPSTQSWSSSPVNRQPRAHSLGQFMTTSRSEMSADTGIIYPTRSSYREVALPEHHYAVERWQNTPPQLASDAHTLNYQEPPSHATQRTPYVHHEHLSSQRSWSSTPLQGRSESLPQIQYQPYRSPSSTEVFPTVPLSPVSTLAPSPVPWQDQNQEWQAPTRLQTPAGLSAYDEGQHPPLSRSITVGETRRKNQRTLLELMSRTSYG